MSAKNSLQETGGLWEVHQAVMHHLLNLVPGHGKSRASYTMVQVEPLPQSLTTALPSREGWECPVQLWAQITGPGARDQPDTLEWMAATYTMSLWLICWFLFIILFLTFWEWFSIY